MPYIKKTDRSRILVEVPMLGKIVDFQSIDNAGELNYTFTIIAKEYLQRKGLKYQHINDIIGALEGAKLELYRRVAASYEDEKIKQNGDV